MKNVLVLGASGQIAQWAVAALADRDDIALTLFLRNPKKLAGNEPANSRVVIGNVLDKPFRRAADAIEASGLDYTIVRPAWLMDEDEVDYELTARDEPFKGTVVSRKSVADLIVKIIEEPQLHTHGNVGVNKPDTE